MKKLFPLVLVLLLCFQVNGQKSVNKLIDKMKEHKKAYALTLPGWVIRTGLKIAGDDELRLEKGFQDLIGGIKKLRVLHVEEGVNIENSKLKAIVSQIKEKDGYVDYATVRDQDKLVYVIVKEDKTKIKSLVLLAKDDDGLTILNLKTDLEMEELKRANLSFNKSKKS